MDKIPPGGVHLLFGSFNIYKISDVWQILDIEDHVLMPNGVRHQRGRRTFAMRAKAVDEVALLAVCDEVIARLPCQISGHSSARVADAITFKVLSLR
jgi:hypothetical protein